jgi:hypothetical protein
MRIDAIPVGKNPPHDVTVDRRLLALAEPVTLLPSTVRTAFTRLRSASRCASGK